MLSVYLVSGIVAMGIADVDPTSPYLFGNYVFSPDNNYIIQSGSSSGTLQYTSASNLQYTQNLSAYGIEQFGSNALVGGNQGAVGATTNFLFPDWIRAGWNWVTTSGRMFLNVVGAPYGLIQGTVTDGALAALLNSFFLLMTLFVLINWILGKDT